MHLGHPGYLALLAILPLIVAVSVRSLAGLGPARQTTAICLRCLVVAALAAALAEPECVRTTDNQTVVFALDQSDSIPHSRQREARAFIRQAAETMRPGKDRVAMLHFAAQPSVQQFPQAELRAERLPASRDTRRTNIARAMRLAMALFPPETARRLVLLSDGNENAGLAASEVDAFAARGIPVDVVPLRYEHDREILVDRLAAPSTATSEEVIDLQLVLRTQVRTSARLYLYRDEKLTDLDPRSPEAGLPLELETGTSRFTIPVPLRRPGVHRFRAVVKPDDPRADSVAANNQGRAVTIVGDPDRVIIITDAIGAVTQVGPSSAAILAEALREGGIDCDLMAVDELPGDPAALADCSAIILSNVSAYALGEGWQDLLASYVRDQGGGLIAVGGDQAFSAGGYAGTPLEEVLPVQTNRDKLKLLSLGMVIVIDSSGSMAGEKIAMARKAAIGAVELLTPRDDVGVLAFAGAFEWIVPLQPAHNRNAIIRRLSAIASGGGTVMYPALREAYAALSAANTNLRHVIVLTDGQSTPADFEGLARACKNNGITISTIAVGPDADRALLGRIAGLSGGRMYIAESARPLPQIFARETTVARRSGLYERPFTPRLLTTIDDRILAGFEQADIPLLRGYVMMAAKPMATAPLIRPTEDGSDPILAYWQVGLGRTVAFTSGLWPKWGSQWAAWPGFSKFWTQAVRYAGRTGDPGDLEIDTNIAGGKLHVTVSAEHLPMRAQGTLSVRGNVVRPGFAVAPLRLQRMSFGRYEATLPVDDPGTYLLNIPYAYNAADGTCAGVLRTSTVLAYSPEHREMRHDEAALRSIARRTAGRVLALSHPGSVFEPWSIRPIEFRRPCWEYLVWAALALFLTDVAVRRIALSPAEVTQNLTRFLHELAGSRPGPGSAATLTALRGAKARARGEEKSPVKPSTPKKPPRGIRKRPESEAATGPQRPARSPEPDPKRPRHQEQSPDSADTDHTSRLLQAKRRARKHKDGSDQP